MNDNLKRDDRKQMIHSSITSKHDNWFLKSEPMLSTFQPSIPQDIKRACETMKLRSDLDQIFNSSKSKGLQSVSPKSSHYKSVASPQYSPGEQSHNMASKSKSQMRESKIDLFFDFDSYTGPRVVVSKDVMINEYCIDHPDKKSKFYIKNNIFSKEDGDMKLYRGFCSKCSVQMAMKGFTVEEVMREDEFNRKARIEGFLQLLAKIQKNDLIKLNKVQNATALLNAYYKQQQDIVDNVFYEIGEILRQKKQIIVHSINLFKETSFAQLDSLSAAIKVKLDTINAMKSDIDSNLEKIITKIDTSPFNQILTNYEHNLDNLNKQITERSQIGKIEIKSKFKGEVEVSLKRLVEEAFVLQKIPIDISQKTHLPKTEDYGMLGKIAEIDSVSEEDPLGHSTRSLGPMNSLQGISRTTNTKEEINTQKNHAFSYQFYKRPSTDFERTVPTSNNEYLSKVNQSKKQRQKDFGALSFDHRIIVSRHRQAEDVEM